MSIEDIKDYGMLVVTALVGALWGSHKSEIKKIDSRLATIENRQFVYLDKAEFNEYKKENREAYQRLYEQTEEAMDRQLLVLEKLAKINETLAALNASIKHGVD